LIEAYSFGRIRIDEAEHTTDLIVDGQGMRGAWRRRKSHVLRIEDLDTALALGPTTLVVGTGRFGLMRVPGKTRRFIEERGVRLVVQRTDRAWRTFNRLASAGGRVVAALHIFC
jgi:hypothetical protein